MTRVLDIVKAGAEAVYRFYLQIALTGGPPCRKLLEKGVNREMRSPNYPAIGLPEAVALAKKVWDAEKRTALSAEQACRTMGYKSVSGASRVKLSALKKYGLLDDLDDKLRLSDRAIVLIHKPQITREYKQAVRDAIGDVDLFAKLLQTHPDASRDTLKTHLIVDCGFTKDGAERFVDSFVSTISLDQTGESGHNPHEQPESSIRVGDVVQWVSQGIARWPTPRTVQELVEHDGKQFARVGSGDNDQGGHVSVDELTKSKNVSVQHPNLNVLSPSAGMGKDTNSTTFPLSCGTALLQWPSNLSQDDFAVLKDWLQIAQRKMQADVKGGSD